MPASTAQQFQGFAIKNAQKPPRSPVTLPTDYKPTFAKIEELQRQLTTSQRDKLNLENDNQRVNDALSKARAEIVRLKRLLGQFIADERSGL
ncbi:hypothetical protein [Rhodobacter lacus]|uniref:Uncharacterized protein n=1 Tax=Rhodobacter lacus TaxID=1641972 RepID=A0ABW5ACN0_9RHOB